MNTLDIDTLINSYTLWIKKEISTLKIGEYYGITSPFMDRFNDYMQIYVKQNDDGTLYLTDDGYIIGNLISSGVNIFSSEKHRNILNMTIKNYGLELHNEDITAICSPENFPQTKNMMIQAMSTIDDMFSLAPNNVKNFFIEDVKTFFDLNNIYYIPDFSLQGKTGSIYKYDFVFQRTKSKPERFCKTINTLNESSRNLTIFNWIDTQEKRQNESELIVIYNDENSNNASDTSAFLNYGIKSIPFSQRKKYTNIFAA